MLREEAFSCVPRLRAGLFSDLPPGEFCPLRIPPFGMAAVSPRDKSRKDGALSPVTSEKATSLSPPRGGDLMPPALREEPHALCEADGHLERVFLCPPIICCDHFGSGSKESRYAGLECEARKTRRKKIEKQVHLVFGFRLHVGFERAVCFPVYSVSLAQRVVKSSFSRFCSFAFS
jgi:hypothetical protein